ncbi:hypothetical protein SUGI_0489310 [Cryptomeria japonica]|nr:hypothetical protein SUGI_0489310 [Cryptomeria japonica]
MRKRNSAHGSFFRRPDLLGHFDAVSEAAIPAGIDSCVCFTPGGWPMGPIATPRLSTDLTLQLIFEISTIPNGNLCFCICKLNQGIKGLIFIRQDVNSS